MAPRPPASRGFTLAERRSLTFERISLYAVFFVALVAAVVSFVAMAWVGKQLGMDWAAPLIPLAIDGFAIACSVGIVRSQASGDRLRERFSEWIGLYVALSLSIAGNVFHVLHTSTELLPTYLKVAFAASIPILLAYGIHVYGRAMSRGISAKVLADDPDKVRFDIQSLHDDARHTAAPARAQHTGARIERAHAPQPVAQPARAQQDLGARADLEGARAAAADAARAEDDRTRMRATFDAAVHAQPTVRPDAAALHREAGAKVNTATSRRWVQAWWSEHETNLGIAREDHQLEDEAAVPEGLRVVG